MPIAADASDPSRLKGMYQKIERWKYSVGRIKTVTSLCLLFIVISIGFSFANVLNEDATLFSQLHGVPAVEEGIAPPTQYWTMDWIMSPMRVYGATGPTWVQTSVAQNMCLETDNACNPVSWQLQTACITTPSTEVSSALYVPQSVKDEQAYFYSNTKTKFRHLQPLFTCMAEKIGLVSLFLNNEHSYSIGSTHSVHVLVSAVFVILAIILTSMLLGAREVNPDAQANTVAMRRLFLVIVVIAYILMAFYTATEHSVKEDQDKHRAIGLASYSYSTFYIVVALIIFNQNKVFSDHANETERFKRDKAKRNGGEKPETSAATAVMGYPAGQPHTNKVVPTGNTPDFDTRQATLSVRGFVREPWHFDDRIKTSYFDRPDPDHVQNKVDLNICDYISIPVHSKYVYGQFLTFPLIVLAFYMNRRNYGIDSVCQLVFICAWVISLVDTFLYRMWWAFQVHKGVTFYSENDRSEYQAMGLITLVGVLFQLSAYLVLILSTFFPTSYIVVMSLYFTFTVLLKAVIVVNITHHMDYNGTNQAQFATARALNKFDHFVGLFQKVDYFVFIGYVLAVAITLWVCIVMDEHRFFKPTWMKETNITDRWGPGWHVFHSLSTGA